MAQEPTKPKEFERFEALTKRLMRVPKDELDQKEKERKRRRKKLRPNSD